MKSLIKKWESPQWIPVFTPWRTRIVGDDPVSFARPIRQPSALGFGLLVGFALTLGVLGDLLSCAWLSLPAFFVRFLSACYYLGIVLAVLRFGFKIGLGTAALAGVFHLSTGTSVCQQSILQQGDLAAFAAVAVLASLLTKPERVQNPKQGPPPDQAGRAGIFPVENLRRSRISPGFMQSVRTPISAIESAGYMLEDSTSTDENQRELVAIILRECRHLDVLTRSLEFWESRPPAYHQVELSSILDEIERLAKPIAEASTLTLRKQANPGVQLVCDAELIEQAALNLLSNATRFVEPEDEIVLSARIDKNNVIVEIFDRRIGALGHIESAIAVAPEAASQVRSLERHTRWIPQIRNE